MSDSWAGISGWRDRTVRRLIRSIIPGVVLAAAVGTAPAAAASAGLAQGTLTAGNTAQGQAIPAVLECGAGAALTRPASLILTCADDGELAEHLQWSSWTASQATATGAVTWRNCVTMCADATQWKSTAADITLTGPVSEPGEGLLFTRLDLNVTGPTPAGFQRTLSFSEAPVPAVPSAPSISQQATTSPAVVQPAAAPSGTLSYAKIEGFWDIAGGPTGRDHIPGHGTYTDSQVAAAITGAESSFLPGVIQPDVDYCGAGSDRAGWGLWQITCGNSVPKFGKDFEVLDPWNNAEAAVYKCDQDMKDGSDCFSPWATWASGKYLQFLQHTAADKKLTDPGEYKQVNSTPPGTPKRPAAHPGSKSGPKMPATKPAPPKVAFTSSMNFLLQEQPAVFNGSASKPGGSKIKSYSWNLGDGTTASGAKATHAFVTSAEVTVTLTVTDTDGQHSSVSHSYFVMPSDSSASSYIAGAGDQEHLFYESSAGALDQDWLSAKKWSNEALPGSAVADPVTLNYASQEHVFYIGKGGAIEQDTWNGKAWVRQTLPGKAATGSALGGTDYASGSGAVGQHLFFTGKNGRLQQTFWTGKTWVNQNLPGKPAAGSPIVSSLYEESGTLRQHVFFIGARDTLQQTWYAGKSWANQTLPGNPETGQNTLATSDYMDNGQLQQHVFFIGAGSTLRQTFWTGKAWVTQKLPGSPVLSGGLVTSDFAPNQEHVFFIRAAGTLQQTWWAGKSWANQKLPGSAFRVLGTNDYPVSALQQRVFFAAPSGALEQTSWSGKGWATRGLPGAAVAR